MTFVPGTFEGLGESEVRLFQRVLSGMSGNAVEIGCLDGYSSVVILDSSNLHLTSIDPFIPDSMVPSLIGDKQRYFANVTPYAGRCKLIENYSELVDEYKLYPARISLLYIDGNHHYEHVVADLVKWVPMLEVNGLLAVHDCRTGRDGGAPFHPGPTQAAAKYLFSQPDAWEIVGEAWSLAIFRKL